MSVFVVTSTQRITGDHVITRNAIATNN